MEENMNSKIFEIYNNMQTKEIKLCTHIITKGKIYFLEINERKKWIFFYCKKDEQTYNYQNKNKFYKSGKIKKKLE